MPNDNNNNMSLPATPQPSPPPPAPPPPPPPPVKVGTKPSTLGVQAAPADLLASIQGGAKLKPIAHNVAIDNEPSSSISGGIMASVNAAAGTGEVSTFESIKQSISKINVNTSDKRIESIIKNIDKGSDISDPEKEQLIGDIGSKFQELNIGIPQKGVVFEAIEEVMGWDYNKTQITALLEGKSKDKASEPVQVPAHTPAHTPTQAQVPAHTSEPTIEKPISSVVESTPLTSASEASKDQAKENAEQEKVRSLIRNIGVFDRRAAINDLNEMKNELTNINKMLTNCKEVSTNSLLDKNIQSKIVKIISTCAEALGARSENDQEEEAEEDTEKHKISTEGKTFATLANDVQKKFGLELDKETLEFIQTHNTAPVVRKLDPSRMQAIEQKIPLGQHTNAVSQVAKKPHDNDPKDDPFDLPPPPPDTAEIVSNEELPPPPALEQVEKSSERTLPLSAQDLDDIVQKWRTEVVAPWQETNIPPPPPSLPLGTQVSDAYKQAVQVEYGKWKEMQDKVAEVQASTSDAAPAQEQPTVDPIPAQSASPAELQILQKQEQEKIAALEKKMGKLAVEEGIDSENVESLLPEVNEFLKECDSVSKDALLTTVPPYIRATQGAFTRIISGCAKAMEKHPEIGKIVSNYAEALKENSETDSPVKPAIALEENSKININNIREFAILAKKAQEKLVLTLKPQVSNFIDTCTKLPIQESSKIAVDTRTPDRVTQLQDQGAQSHQNATPVESHDTIIDPAQQDLAHLPPLPPPSHDLWKGLDEEGIVDHNLPPPPPEEGVEAIKLEPLSLNISTDSPSTKHPRPPVAPRSTKKVVLTSVDDTIIDPAQQGLHPWMQETSTHDDFPPLQPDKEGESLDDLSLPYNIPLPSDHIDHSGGTTLASRVQSLIDNVELSESSTDTTENSSLSAAAKPKTKPAIPPKPNVQLKKVALASALEAELPSSSNTDFPDLPPFLLADQNEEEKESETYQDPNKPPPPPEKPDEDLPDIPEDSGRDGDRSSSDSGKHEEEPSHASRVIEKSLPDHVESSESSSDDEYLLPHSMDPSSVVQPFQETGNQETQHVLPVSSEVPNNTLTIPDTAASSSSVSSVKSNDPRTLSPEDNAFGDALLDHLPSSSPLPVKQSEVDNTAREPEGDASAPALSPFVEPKKDTLEPQTDIPPPDPLLQPIEPQTDPEPSMSHAEPQIDSADHPPKKEPGKLLASQFDFLNSTPEVVQGFSANRGKVPWKLSPGNYPEHDVSTEHRGKKPTTPRVYNPQEPAEPVESEILEPGLSPVEPQENTPVPELDYTPTNRKVGKLSQFRVEQFAAKLTPPIVQKFSPQSNGGVVQSNPQGKAGAQPREPFLPPPLPPIPYQPHGNPDPIDQRGTPAPGGRPPSFGRHYAPPPPPPPAPPYPPLPRRLPSQVDHSGFTPELTDELNKVTDSLAELEQQAPSKVSFNREGAIAKYLEGDPKVLARDMDKNLARHNLWKELFEQDIDATTAEIKGVFPPDILDKMNKVTEALEKRQQKRSSVFGKIKQKTGDYSTIIAHAFKKLFGKKVDNPNLKNACSEYVGLVSQVRQPKRGQAHSTARRVIR